MYLRVFIHKLLFHNLKIINIILLDNSKKIQKTYVLQALQKILQKL